MYHYDYCELYAADFASLSESTGMITLIPGTYSISAGIYTRTAIKYTGNLDFTIALRDSNDNLLNINVIRYPVSNTYKAVAGPMLASRLLTCDSNITIGLYARCSSNEVGAYVEAGNHDTYLSIIKIN